MLFLLVKGLVFCDFNCYCNSISSINVLFIKCKVVKFNGLILLFCNVIWYSKELVVNVYSVIKV